MHLSNCLNPQRIYNKYLDMYQTVPCGKCDACRNIHAYNWEQRLIQESKKSNYTVFFTLTYSSAFLPMFVKHGDVLVSAPRKYVYRTKDKVLHIKTISDGLCVPVSSIDFSDLRDRRYFNNYNSFCYPSVDDIQKFVKRLRYHIHELFKEDCTLNEDDNEIISRGFAEEKTRYFIISEYGGCTHRVHYHGLLFFNSRKIADNISSLIYESWRMCDRDCIDVQFSDSRSISYVTKYLNVNDYLPSVYRLRDTRPIALFSRRPFIGHDSLSKEQVRQIICDSKVQIPIVSDQAKKILVTRLNHSFERRYFPRVYGYDSFFDSDRIYAYTLVSGTRSSSFVEFFQSVQCAVKYDIEYYNPYFQVIRYIDKRIMRCITDDYTFDSYRDTWRRIYDCNVLVMRNAEFFNLDLKYYIKKIFDYYVAVDSLKLHSQYEFMFDYVNDPYGFNDPNDLVCMFPDSVEDYKERLSKTNDFISLKSLNYKIAKDMRDNKDRKAIQRSKNVRITRRVY